MPFVPVHFRRQPRPRKPSAALLALLDERSAVQRGVAIVVYCPRFAGIQLACEMRRRARPPENPFAKIKSAVAGAQPKAQQLALI